MQLIQSTLKVMQGVFQNLFETVITRLPITDLIFKKKSLFTSDGIDCKFCSAIFLMVLQYFSIVIFKSCFMTFHLHAECD